MLIYKKCPDVSCFVRFRYCTAINEANKVTVQPHDALQMSDVSDNIASAGERVIQPFLPVHARGNLTLKTKDI